MGSHHQSRVLKEVHLLNSLGPYTLQNSCLSHIPGMPSTGVHLTAGFALHFGHVLLGPSRGLPFQAILLYTQPRPTTGDGALAETLALLSIGPTIQVVQRLDLH